MISRPATHLTLFLGLAIGLAGCAEPRTPPTVSPPESSVVEWVSRAATVADLARVSDVIVRARVTVAPATRVLRQALPQVDANGTPVAIVTDTLLFADTTFEVIETYSGTVSSSVLVMQTGGISAESGAVIEFEEDPLYRLDETCVLFLIDISGDAVHAPDRVLYRTVSPAGRFTIDGEAVHSFAADPPTRAAQPATLADLLAQIDAAVP